MTETVVEIRLPTNLLRLGLDKEDIQQRLVEWLVLSLFMEGRVSSGKAADLLNISHSAFLDLLQLRGIAYLDTSPDELGEEFAVVEALEVSPNQ